MHGKYNGRERKAEIHFLHGRIIKIVLKDKGQGLEPKKRKDFEQFVHARATEIVEKWIDYFIKKKPVSPQIINHRIKNVRTIG